MEEYIDDAIEVREAYDKEEALIDYGGQLGEGRKQIEIAKNLLQTDLTMEEISKATGLDIREIEALKP